jgi:hypothetical protein
MELLGKGLGNASRLAPAPPQRGGGLRFRVEQQGLAKIGNPDGSVKRESRQARAFGLGSFIGNFY